MEQMAHALGKYSPESIQKQRHYSLNSTDVYEAEGKPRRRLPPLIVPERHPREIMAQCFNSDQIGAITDLLKKFRKSHQNWDEWRKINWTETLADKWSACLLEIRKNGYINPEISNGKIVFSQVLRTGSEPGNKCSVCPNRLDKGECLGRRAEMADKAMTIKRGDFVPCWKEGEIKVSYGN